MRSLLIIAGMTHLPGGPRDPADPCIDEFFLENGGGEWRGWDCSSTSIDQRRTRRLCIDSRTALPGAIVGTDGRMKIEGNLPRRN